MITHIRMLIGSFFLFLQSLFSFPKIDESIYNIKENKETEIELSESDEEEQLDKTIMSYNIHSGFDLRYNFRLNQMIEFINNNRTSILCLQEVSNLEQYNYIKQETGYRYGEFSHNKCVLSDFKIVAIDIFEFTHMNLYKKNVSLHLVLDVKGTDLNIFNVHFSSDISGFKQLNEKQDLDEYITDNNIEDFIIIGDTNSINLFEKNDAFVNYNKVTFGRTYPSELPVFELDKAYSKGLELLDSTIYSNIKVSDHLPISAIFKFN